jgi:hypothetical protein
MKQLAQRAGYPLAGAEVSSGHEKKRTVDLGGHPRPVNRITKQQTSPRVAREGPSKPQ